MSAYGSFVRDRRELLGLSREELARRAFVWADTVRQLEEGDYLPTGLTLELVGEAIGVCTLEAWPPYLDLARDMEPKDDGMPSMYYSSSLHVSFGLGVQALSVDNVRASRRTGLKTNTA
jgi:transcriptional regulator with XRE-family HTH domain